MKKTIMNNTKKFRIAATADIHIRKTSTGSFQAFFSEISQSADVLVMSGDLTSYGLVEEAEVLAGELKALTIPKLAVLGNHDHENGKQEEVKRVLKQAGML